MIEGSELEYCKGYYDEHHIWNNGFHCPRWGGLDMSYCCGTETNRYCCPEKQSKDLDTPQNPHSIKIPLIVGLCVALLIFIFIILLCIFHPRCPIYKRRKRVLQGPIQCPACRHQTHMPVVITNENGYTRACAETDCSPSSLRSPVGPPSYCQVCRAEGLRWQHGMSDLDVLFPIDDPPPYSDEEEDTEDKEDNKPQDNITRFTSFHGSPSTSRASSSVATSSGSRPTSSTSRNSNIPLVKSHVTSETDILIQSESEVDTSFHHREPVLRTHKPRNMDSYARLSRTSVSIVNPRPITMESLLSNSDEEAEVWSQDEVN